MKESAPDFFRMSCPECGQPIECPNEIYNTAISCPACNKEVLAQPDENPVEAEAEQRVEAVSHGEPWKFTDQSNLLAALKPVAVAVGCCAAFYLLSKACAFMDDNHHRVWTNQTVVNGEYQAWRKDLDDLSIVFWWGILPFVGIGSLVGLFSSLAQSFRQTKERAVTCLAYSIIALAFLFYAMPSGKQISENQEQFKAAQKIYDDYHGMPGAAREYTDYLVKEGGASTKWFDQQYYDALSMPRSRLTPSVIFWGLVSLFFFCSAAYLSFSSRR